MQLAAGAFGWQRLPDAFSNFDALSDFNASFVSSSGKPMRLLLIRHGESVGNVNPAIVIRSPRYDVAD